MECAAALSMNQLDVTMVFPEATVMPRLFTPEMAAFYEGFYKEKGIKILKGELVTSLEGQAGKVGGHACGHGQFDVGALWLFVWRICIRLTSTGSYFIWVQVTHAVLKSGTRLECSLVLVGVGARPNTELFNAGQLELLQGPPGGIKVNGHLQVWWVDARVCLLQTSLHQASIN